MDDLEMRMRGVLLALSLLSNGRTSSFDASGSSDPDYTPTLSTGDAPQLYYARRWDAARDDIERAAILDAATARLNQEQRSRGDRTRVEPKADRDARIVAVGEGWTARDVANHFKTGIKDVWRAREAAGRDREYGRRPRQIAGDEQLHDEATRMAAEGMSERQIAFSLAVHRNVVRRLLGR